MTRRPRRILTVRDFRANFQKLTEPVQVLRSRGTVEILGTWIPDTTRTPVRYPAEQPDIAHPERSGEG
jgi:uncharacterized protein (DUF3084 family)